jgi:hypothetical protein
MIDNSTSTYIYNTAGLTTYGGLDDYNLSRWKGTSDLNRTQVLQLNYVYALPFFRNSTNVVAR